MATYDTEQVRQALRAVLRPLADLMITSGITLSNATELLKQVLYDAAQTRGPGPMNDSQVSLLTGLHRKDVRRFREAQATRERASYATASARLIAHWRTDPAYLDAEGGPIALPRMAEKGPSFDGLVQALRFDLAPGTVLAHLTAMDLVAEEADGHLRLLASAYVPKPGSDALLRAFEKNIAAHLTAAVDNLALDPAPHFERASHFNKLTAESAAALDALARQLAEDHLAAFTKEAQRRQTADMVQADATHRVTFGSYVIDRDATKKGTGKT